MELQSSPKIIFLIQQIVILVRLFASCYLRWRSTLLEINLKVRRAEILMAYLELTVKVANDSRS
jgi:hypothetical protein